MTEAAKYVLRDLPGVRELEDRLERIDAHQNPEWAPERDGLDEAVERLARRLFGIGFDDTRFDPDLDRSEAEIEAEWRRWELNFACLHPMDEDEDEAAAKVFLAMGWDVTDVNGLDMLVLEHIGRELICATKGLRGHLPGVSVPLTAAEEKGLEARLKAEADKFRKGR
jgi:hypothetical protein